MPRQTVVFAFAIASLFAIAFAFLRLVYFHPGRFHAVSQVDRWMYGDELPNDAVEVTSFSIASGGVLVVTKNGCGASKLIASRQCVITLLRNDFDTVSGTSTERMTGNDISTSDSSTSGFPDFIVDGVPCRLQPQEPPSPQFVLSYRDPEIENELANGALPLPTRDVTKLPRNDWKRYGIDDDGRLANSESVWNLPTKRLRLIEATKPRSKAGALAFRYITDVNSRAAPPIIMMLGDRMVYADFGSIETLASSHDDLPDLALHQPSEPRRLLSFDGNEYLRAPCQPI